MGKLITFIVILLSSVSSTAQKPSYDANGNINGIILTLEEASKVDNDYELLKLYKELNTEYQELENMYISLVDNNNKEIELLEIKTNLLEEQLKDSNSIILNLRKQNMLLIDNSVLYEKELTLKNDMITGLNKSLKREKQAKWIVITAAIIGGGLIYFTK